MVQALVNNVYDIMNIASSAASENSQALNFQDVFKSQNSSRESSEFDESNLDSATETLADDYTTEFSDKQNSSVNSDEADVVQILAATVVLPDIISVSESDNQEIQQDSEAAIMQVDAEKAENMKNTLSVRIDNENNISLGDEIDVITSSEEEMFLEKDGIKKPDNEVSLEDLADEDVLKELKIESVSAESSGSESNSGSDIMQFQTPQEQGVKAVLNVDAEFVVDVDMTTGSAANVSMNKAVEISPSKIIEQITKQMEGLQNNSKVNIVLNPESLGKVTIQLINTKEGLSAQFTVATQEARDLIMKGLNDLKTNLLGQGVNVDNISVKINDSQKSEQNSDWTEQEGSRGGNKEQGSKKKQKDVDLFEKMMSFANEEEKEEV